MIRCPNCGQKTSGEYCQWCKYPILRGGKIKQKTAEKPAKKEANRAATEKARREAEETKKAKEAEKQAKKEANRAAAEKARREAKEAKKPLRDTDSEIYEGDFRLVVPLTTGFEKLNQFKESIERIENITIIWSGGSIDEGAVIGISVHKPIDLVRILNEMAIVEKVDKKGYTIVVVLKNLTVL